VTFCIVPINPSVLWNGKKLLWLIYDNHFAEPHFALLLSPDAQGFGAFIDFISTLSGKQR
jgi:hypothetical protein